MGVTERPRGSPPSGLRLDRLEARGAVPPTVGTEPRSKPRRQAGPPGGRGEEEAMGEPPGPFPPATAPEPDRKSPPKSPASPAASLKAWPRGPRGGGCAGRSRDGGEAGGLREDTCRSSHSSKNYSGGGHLAPFSPQINHWTATCSVPPCYRLQPPRTRGSAHKGLNLPSLCGARRPGRALPGEVAASEPTAQRLPLAEVPAPRPSMCVPAHVHPPRRQASHRRPRLPGRSRG